MGAGERTGSRNEFLDALRNRFEEAGRDGKRGFRSNAQASRTVEPGGVGGGTAAMTRGAIQGAVALALRRRL